MDRTFYLSIAIYAIWILVPLIPAIVIYKLFPDTKVALSGPFSSLTLNTAGAFAAYMVVVIASVYMLDKVLLDVRSEARTYWTLGARLQVYDGTTPAANINEDDIDIDINPATVSYDNGYLRVTVPRENHRWPHRMRINVAGYGAQDFEFEDTGLIDNDLNRINWETEPDLREIELQAPIVIVKRRSPSDLLAMAAPGAATDAPTPIAPAPPGPGAAP